MMARMMVRIIDMMIVMYTGSCDVESTNHHENNPVNMKAYMIVNMMTDMIVNMITNMIVNMIVNMKANMIINMKANM